METEYVEKQVAIKAVCDACYVVPDREKENCQYKYEGAGCTEYDKIINVPPADVRPIRRGRWTLHDDWSGTCSECGIRQMLVWDADGWMNYCPNCGADMRGAE